MIAALSTALTGLHASAAHLQASASNIANAASTGPLRPAEAGDAPADVRRAYLPVDVVLADRRQGGVAATYRPREPAAAPAFDPASPDADTGGFVAAPNVDLATEAVGSIEAALAFRANLAVMRSAGRMLDSLLDRMA
jgi:flagellar basal body rod protein FlgC